MSNTYNPFEEKAQIESPSVVNTGRVVTDESIAHGWLGLPDFERHLNEMYGRNVNTSYVAQAVNIVKRFHGIEDNVRIVVGMPLHGSGTGGFHADVENNPGLDMSLIAINPAMFLGPDSLIKVVGVVVHELGHHAGIADEALNQFLTNLILMEVLGGRLPSGYDEIESEFGQSLKRAGIDADFEQLYLSFKEGGKESLNNFIHMFAVKPVLNKLAPDGKFDFKDLKNLQQNIQKNMSGAFNIARELFPRMLNDAAENGAGVHDEANLDYAGWEAMEGGGMDNLMEDIVTKMFETDSLNIAVMIGDMIAEASSKVEYEGQDAEYQKAIFNNLMNNGFEIVNKDERLSQIFEEQVQLKLAELKLAYQASNLQADVIQLPALAQVA